MSRFYGSLSGAAKTSATRRGHAASGVDSHVRGWRLGAASGAYALCPYHDAVTCALTSGSVPGVAAPLRMTATEAVGANLDFHISIGVYSVTGTFNAQGELIFLRGCPDFTPKEEKPA